MAESLEDLFIPTIFTFSAFAPIFLFCELGDRITNETNEAYNEILRCEWYLAPIKVQKILPITLIGTQKPIYLSGFGNIVCTREAFKNVRNFTFTLKLNILLNLKPFRFQVISRGYSYFTMVNRLKQ